MTSEMEMLDLVMLLRSSQILTVIVICKFLKSNFIKEMIQRHVVHKGAGGVVSHITGNIIFACRRILEKTAIDGSQRLHEWIIIPDAEFDTEHLQSKCY